MRSWYDTTFCKGGTKCVRCRRHGKGREWRRRVTEQYEVDGGVDFTCPEGKEWVHDNPSGIRYDLSPRTLAENILKALHDVADSKEKRILVTRGADVERKRSLNCGLCAMHARQRLVDRFDDLRDRLNPQGAVSGLVKWRYKEKTHGNK